MTPEEFRICVVGLGYVGLPIAAAFGKHYPTVGYDIDERRVRELLEGHDSRFEVSEDTLNEASHLSFTCDPSATDTATIYIVTVPTPVGEDNQPDLSALLGACETVGGFLRQGNIVVFESTVYPGLTEDICVPALERKSKLKFNRDFFVGYSPERINPGDPAHQLSTVTKVVSGSNEKTARTVERLYSSVVDAGIHRAPSIAVAEMAKVIENTQRDLNIALVNEIAMICSKLGIDTGDVLDAAGTKWNFLPFTPGLVGGHCIGVDPYYLTFKALEIGHHPRVILAGREVNNDVPQFVSDEMVRLLNSRGRDIKSCRVLVLGLAFKENTHDIRNTKVVDLVSALQDAGASVDVVDPCVDSSRSDIPDNVNLIEEPPSNAYDGIILAVAHREFLNDQFSRYQLCGTAQCVIYDVKRTLLRSDVAGRL